MGIQKFLEDYRTARRLLAEGKTFEIGRFTGIEIKSEAEFHAWFMGCLNRKINRLGHVEVQGRKNSREYFYAAYRDQQAIYHKIRRRVAVYAFETREARERFSHLLSSYSD